MLCLIWSALFRLASALSNVGYLPKGPNCLGSILPVTVTSNNRPWIAPRWKSNYEFIDFLFSASSRPSAGFPLPLGNNTVKQIGSYPIGVTFCTQEIIPTPTHGFGFDRRYNFIFSNVAAM